MRLARAGITPDARVTVHLHDARVRKALELIFKSADPEEEGDQLGYRVNNGILSITTRKELNKVRFTRTYEIGDLIRDSSGAPGSEDERTAHKADLTKYIVDNADPDSWKDNGGDVGSISNGPVKDTLLITQTPETHRKIRKILADLRASFGELSYPAPPALGGFTFTPASHPTTVPLLPTTKP